MNRRHFLGIAGAAALSSGIQLRAQSAFTTAGKTQWVVRTSEGFDALSFLSPLSGDPFYLPYYENEVAEFAARMPEPSMAALKTLMTRARQADILLSPYLDLRFSAGPAETIDDLLLSAAIPDNRLLPAFRASQYWDEADEDEEEEWAQFKTALPAVSVVLQGLKTAGFPEFLKRILEPKAERVAALKTKLDRFDPIAGAEFYTGRRFAPTIEIVLLQFCKPHGIKVIGQRFLSAIDWPDDVHIRTAGHEILHPPVDMDGPAARAALAILEQDALLLRVVREHDPKFGYNSIQGIFDEDLTSAIDQLIAEKSGVARDARERWNEVDGGMHILSAAFYGLMKQDGFARTGGNLEQWLLRQARSGRLAPASLHAAASRVLGRPADALWPPPQA